MVFIDTPQMQMLWNKVKPYFNERMQLPDNVPDDIKQAFNEYKRLSDEREEFALVE